MNKLVWVLLGIGGIIILTKRSEKMKKKEVKMDEQLKESVQKVEAVKLVQRDENGLSDADKRELTERFKGMSQAEIDIFMDLVPIDMCVARIQKELDRAKEFETAIKAMTTIFGS